ncbi:MAG TPA: PEP-CTERM sorting domain-containing protein [Halomicronema sp.]
MKTQLFTTISVAAATLLSISAPAQAATFGTSGIQFDSNTTVNFNFIRSQGAFQSSLGVYEVLTQGSRTVTSLVSTLFSEAKGSDFQGAAGRASEFAGTLAGGTVTNATASFQFLAGKVYTLGLVSKFDGNINQLTHNRIVNTVYSTSSLNTRWNGSQQAVFGTNLGLNNTSTAAYANAGAAVSANPFVQGGIRIAFDDRGNGNDADFQDFQVNAEAVPEPTTMAGMALGAAGLGWARRRRQSKNENKN